MSLRSLLVTWHVPLKIQHIPVVPQKTKLASQKIKADFPLIEAIEVPSNYDLLESYKRVSRIFTSAKTLTGISGKDLRLIPWMLYEYKDPICLGTHPSFYQNYMELLATQKSAIKRRAIQNLWHILLLRYPFESPFFHEWVAEMLALIKETAGQRFVTLHALNTQYDFFNPNGVKSCAEDAFRSGGITASFQDRQLKGELASGGFARHVFVAYLTLVSELLQRNGNLNELKEHLTRLENERELFTAASMKPLVIIEPLLSPFTSKQANNLEHEYRETIKAFLLKHFGDPRFAAHRSKWSAVPPDLEAVMRRWLVAEELNLFFYIIEKTADEKWKERRDFWLGYFRRGVISEAWLVLGRDAQFYARQVRFDAFARLTGGAGANQSVLLMRISNLTIAEWSHDGACRIWQDGDKQVPEFYESSYDGPLQLRSTSLARIPHQGNWQGKIKTAIFNYTRILP